MLSAKIKEKKCQNIKRLPESFFFNEGQMHQNQSVYFNFCATVLLKQYLG